MGEERFKIKKEKKRYVLSNDGIVQDDFACKIIIRLRAFIFIRIIKVIAIRFRIIAVIIEEVVIHVRIIVAFREITPGRTIIPKERER